MGAVEPVAIVGIGCRFPGASGPDAFWRLLAGGVDAISEVPPDRWSLEEFYDDDPAAPGKMNTRWGGFVDGVDKFDAAFFGISPREAAHIDPQQRLLMEVAWEALEDAGLPAERLRGQRVGVFVGTSSYDYGGLQFSRSNDIRDGYMNIGSNLSILANRISYFFDFRGPSIVIDTACSSSLVAAYYACQSLDRGDSRVALAGGVNIILSPIVTIGFSKLQAMAPDGRCKAFDARANGFVRAEGAGLVVLKPLANAVADGDRIYAVIRGGAINQDGRTNGLTAPNGLSQEALLREAFSNSGVAPSEIQFVEAHGTGTALGDPIELNALGAVLSAGRSREARCAVGSVKTNVGHLEAAAGVASLIKVALSIDRRQLPPSLHFNTPNPYIRFDVLPLRVVTALEPLPVESGQIKTGVSAFGFGGTNVHLVLEAPPVRAEAERSRDIQPCILPVSARSETALSRLVRGYAARLAAAAPGESLVDVCATAAARRSHHDFRLAVVGSTCEEMASKLMSHFEGQRVRGVETGRRIGSRRKKIAFVFPGHGAQWVGMGRELVRSESVFADAIAKCACAFSEHVDWSLTSELEAGEERSRLNDVDVVQPAMFAIQVALGDLWRSWGITPDVVVGHSMGEVAAACVAGALSLEDAARIICHRGRLAKRASGRGAMAMVELPLGRTTEILSGYEDRLGVAACNSPTSTVLSGDTGALDEVLVRLQRSGVFCRRVNIGYASHSPHMDPLKDELFSMIEGVVPRRTKVAFCSTVAGAIIPATDLGAAYWVRNLREPVLFGNAIEKLLQDGIDVFLEIGPHPILLSAIQECMAHVKRYGTTIASLRRQENERQSLLAALASLYAIGRPVDWSGVYPSGSQCVSLPSYPWERERFWFDEAGAQPAGKSRGWLKPTSPLLGEHIRPAVGPPTHIWQREVSSEAFPFLNDHRFQRQIVVPATAFLEMALEAAREALGETASFTLENVQFEKALLLAEHETRNIQLVVTERGQNTLDWEIFSAIPEGTPTHGPGFVRHVHGELRIDGIEADTADGSESVAAIRARCPIETTSADHYRVLAALKMDYGPSFQGVESVWSGEREAIARLKPAVSSSLRFRLHPGVLDGALQVLVAGLSTTRTTFALVSAGRFHLHKPLDVSGGLYAHATWESDGTSARGSVRLLAATGELVAHAGDIGLRAFEISAVNDSAEPALPARDKQPIGADALPGDDPLRTALMTAEPEDRINLLTGRLREYVAAVLRLASAKVDLDQPLTTMGIDSLMAVELKTRVEAELGVTIPLLQLVKGPSLSELARSLVGSVTEAAPASGTQRSDPLLFSLLSSKAKASQNGGVNAQSKELSNEDDGDH